MFNSQHLSDSTQNLGVLLFKRRVFFVFCFFLGGLGLGMCLGRGLPVFNANNKGFECNLGYE